MDLALIKAITDALPVGVWVARVPDGELVYANEQFAEILGMTARDDVAAGGYSRPYGIHDRTGALYPEDRLPFARAVAERRTVTVDDLVIHRHDGRRVYVRAFARPLTGPDGELTMVLVAFIDITREVEAELGLRRAQRMESIGTLAGGIAHDFHNLLTPLTVLQSGLQRTETDPRRREALRVIGETAERALALTRSLLGFVGRAPHRGDGPVSLADVARTMVDIARRTFGHGYRIDLELTGDDGPIHGDSGQLEQALMNLLINARDAMADGGTISVAVRGRGEGVVVLEVRDHGDGIDPAIRERIFEPYFTTKTAEGLRGAGLGLAVVFGIVQSHHGTVEVEDAGPGTIMRLVLPRAAR